MPKITIKLPSKLSKTPLGPEAKKGSPRNDIPNIKRPSVRDLQSIKSTNEDKYGQPEKTKKAYEGYVKNGKAFLATLVEKRRAEDKTEDEIQETNGIEKAFNTDKPNKQSAIALELFLTQKCLNEGKGMSTATGIHGAFARYWDKM